MPFDPNANYIEETDLMKGIRQVALVLSFSLFGFFLFCKCYCIENDCTPSFFALLLGWMGNISWLANPLLIIAWYRLSKRKSNTWIFGLLAILASLSFLWFNKVLINEAGHYSSITKLEIGYWLWLFSCAITFIGSTLIVYLRKKQLTNQSL
jgi:FtsH-binding integral membrane protein